MNSLPSMLVAVRLVCWTVAVLASGGAIAVADEPAANANAGARTATAELALKALRDQVPEIDAEVFEAERLKGTEELGAIHKELQDCYHNDDFEGLDRIVQRYRDKPYTLVWGNSALKEVYVWLASLSPEQTGEQHEAWLNKWLDARSRSATPRILLARRYMVWAWEARGSGFAETVTDEGWELFHQRLEQAEAYLSQAEKSEHPDAELYALRVAIAKGLSADRDVVDAALAAGIKLDPGYHSLYEATATYLLPRWHGQPGEVEQFAEDLTKQLGAELGSEMYMRVAITVLSYERSRFFTNTSFDYDKILAGWLAFSAKYQSHVNYQNEVAYLASIQRDRETLFRLLNALNDDQLSDFTWGSTDSAKAWRKWSATKVDPGEAIQVFSADRAALREVAFSPNGRQLVTFGMRSVDPVLIWDVATGRLQSRLLSTREPIFAYAVSADRKFALAGGGEAIESSPKLILWSLDDSALPGATPAPTSIVNGVAFSHRGDRFASVQSDRVITIWDPEDLTEEVASIEIFDKQRDDTALKQYNAASESAKCQGVIFSGDDTRLLAVLIDRELRVWNVEDGKLLQRWCDDAGDDPEVAAIASAPDGSFIGIGYSAFNGRPLDIVDGKTLQPVARIAHQARIVGSIAFSDDGNIVAVTGDNRFLAIFASKSGKELHRFSFKRGEAAVSVAFSPDGTKMAAALTDGTARLWDITPYLPATP